MLIANQEPQNIKITLVKNVPLVDGKINDSEGLKFLIDTGVDPSVIDANAARRLGLPVDESNVSEASGSGDDAGLAIMRSSIQGLQIDGRKFETFNALAADLSSFSNALATPLAGILGYSFISGKVIRFDFKAHEIALSSSFEDLPMASTPTSSTYCAPLRTNSPDDPIPVFDIVIDGEPIAVSLDTGKSSGIEFYKPVWERLQLPSTSLVTGKADRLGARGKRVVMTARLPLVKLGPFASSDVPASFSEKFPKNETREGNAGNAFLNNFVVTIDYAKRQICFAR